MSKLLISTTDWSFYKEGLVAKDFYESLRSLGVSAVEMASRERWGDVRKAGLRLLNIGGPGMSVGINRTENHDELLPAISEAISSARDNGISQVIVFSGNRAGQSDHEGKQNCVTVLKELAPLAEKAGVTLVFEMLGTKDHPDYQADRSSFGFEVVRGVGSPAVKALYDIYHMHWMDEDVVSDIVENMDLIAHLHVAERIQRSQPVKGGKIDYATIVGKVYEASYRGYWGLEFVPRGDALREIEDSIALLESFV